MSALEKAPRGSTRHPYKEFQEFVKHDNCLENYRDNIASAHHTIFYTVWEK